MQRPGSSRPAANPRAENSAFDLFHGAGFEDKPLWAGLYQNLRDALFPSRLPPLELTSKPIPVPDRMAARTNPWAIGTATVVNGGTMALAILLGMKAAINRFPATPTGAHVNISDLHIFAPLPAKPSNGGNGGGTHDLIDPTEGRNPPFASAPIAPPMVPLIQQPKLPAESAIDIRLPDDNAMPNIGVHNSTNVTLASNGPGIHGGMGTGKNGGDGPGNGNRGRGPDSGNTIYSPGQAGVVVPALIYAPEAEFSDEARRYKYQGVCMIAVIVDAHGNPQDAHVIRALGMGLDEKALEAIRRYRFKPGTKDGKPVPVMITVRVDFNLF
jgi:TonB family protein